MIVPVISNNLSARVDLPCCTFPERILKVSLVCTPTECGRKRRNEAYIDMSDDRDVPVHSHISSYQPLSRPYTRVPPRHKADLPDLVFGEQAHIPDPGMWISLALV